MEAYAERCARIAAAFSSAPKVSGEAQGKEQTDPSRPAPRRDYPAAVLWLLRSSLRHGAEFVEDVARALPRGPRAVRGQLVAWHASMQVWRSSRPVRRSDATADQSRPDGFPSDALPARTLTSALDDVHEATRRLPSGPWDAGLRQAYAGLFAAAKAAESQGAATEGPAR